MNRRSFLKLLAAVPLVGRFVSRASPTIPPTTIILPPGTHHLEAAARQLAVNFRYPETETDEYYEWEREQWRLLYQRIAEATFGRPVEITRPPMVSYLDPRIDVEIEKLVADYSKSYFDV